MAISGGTYLALTSHNPLGGVSSALPADDLEFFKLSETITFSGTGATADSTSGLLPAASIILAVMGTVTTAISGTTITGWSLGEATTADRWGSSLGLTVGSTNSAAYHTPWLGSISTDATGPTQAAAAAIRITGTGGGSTVAAGAVRVTVIGYKLKYGSTGV